MQTKIIQGLPFLLNSATNQIYAYEKPVSNQPLLLGSFDPVTEDYKLSDTWRLCYEPRLSSYRGSEPIRSRLPTAASLSAETVKETKKQPKKKKTQGSAA
jgi:hypothetical protein